MKININEINENFSPVEIHLTLETESELIDFWHRVNMGLSVLKDSTLYKGGEYYPGLQRINDTWSGGVWEQIDRIVKKRNIEV